MNVLNAKNLGCYYYSYRHTADVGAFGAAAEKA